MPASDDLLNPARVHDDDAVRQRKRLGLSVSDENERHAEPALQQLELVLNALAQIRVESAERLVEQQNFRFNDKRAS